MTEIFDRAFGLFERACDDRLELRVAAHEHCEPAQLEQDDDEALLRSVMEVALDPAALDVCRFDEAQPGRVQLFQLDDKIAVQTITFHRDPHRRYERVQEDG